MSRRYEKNGEISIRRKVLGTELVLFLDKSSWYFLAEEEPRLSKRIDIFGLTSPNFVQGVPVQSKRLLQQ